MHFPFVILSDSERAYASEEESKDPDDLCLTMLIQGVSRRICPSELRRSDRI